MTEAEWFASRNSLELLASVSGTASDRKARLFCTACCERIEHHLLTVKGAARSLVLAVRIADRVPIDENVAELRLRLSYEAFQRIDGYRHERIDPLRNSS